MSMNGGGDDQGDRKDAAARVIQAKFREGKGKPDRGEGRLHPQAQAQQEQELESGERDGDQVIDGTEREEKAAKTIQDKFRENDELTSGKRWDGELTC